MFKDRKLRKLLWGFWYTQDRETGGPNLTLDDKWNIPMSDGVIRFLLKKLDTLESEIEALKNKKK